MNSETDTERLDILKLSVALLIILADLVCFYLFNEYSLLLRVIALLAGAGIGIAIALQTAKGKEIWSYFHDAQIEVRKVVWPTRQETIQTTLIVVVMVILVAIILWLLDMFLGWSIGSIMGHGG
jgi:preprotein translocase subunit SecE